MGLIFQQDQIQNSLFKPQLVVKRVLISNKCSEEYLIKCEPFSKYILGGDRF